MQKRYVLALAIVASVASLSAQQGPACPYQDAEHAAAVPVDNAGMSDGTLGGGPLLMGRSAFFAP